MVTVDAPLESASASASAAEELRPAVRILGLGKVYCKSLKRSMLYGFNDLGRELFGGWWPERRLGVSSTKDDADGTHRPLRAGEFWSIEDLTLDFYPGEWLGVVGPNGAGKSTLLKLLNGIIRPDAGRIEVYGRLAALIELGAGFHPQLTGRENLQVQSALLGFTPEQLRERTDDILAFADIGDFLDSPLKFYSSGMQARLGFAIAAHLDPDILIVDEVLAVGDIAFQHKCMRKMEELRERRKAVLMVQQHTYWIEALCDRALWLEKGRCRMLDRTRDVVRAYLDDQDHKIISAATRQEAVTHSHDPVEANADIDANPVAIESVTLLGASGQEQEEFAYGERMTVRIAYNARRKVLGPLFNFRVYHHGQGIFEASMLIDGPVVDEITGRGVVECSLGPLPLTPRTYELVLFARARDGILDILPMRTYAVFRIGETGFVQFPLAGPMALNHLRQGAPIYIPHTWRFLAADDQRNASSANSPLEEVSNRL